MAPAQQAMRSGVVAIVSAVALTACVTAQQQITHREDDLAAAGFIVKPANTPQRQQMLARLPANKFVRRTHEDEVHYVYADPVVCKCLYVGSQQAYGAFKKHEQDQRLADEQQMNAEIYSDSAWQWDAWGPWGPGYRFSYGPYGW
jgi:hypothetical protein